MHGCISGQFRSHIENHILELGGGETSYILNMFTPKSLGKMNPF